MPASASARPEIIKMDYGMTDGLIRMRVRAAAGYVTAALERGCFTKSASQKKKHRLCPATAGLQYGVENVNSRPATHPGDKLEQRK